MGATATDNFPVTATAIGTCRITASPGIAFGDYDAAVAKDGSGTFAFWCTRGLGYKLYISGPRQMSGVTTPAEILPFELYSDVGRTAVFPSDNSSTLTGTGSGPAVTITQNVYGRIPANADVTAQNYSTTLTATVDY